MHFRDFSFHRTVSCSKRSNRQTIDFSLNGFHHVIQQPGYAPERREGRRPMSADAPNQFVGLPSASAERSASLYMAPTEHQSPHQKLSVHSSGQAGNFALTTASGLRPAGAQKLGRGEPNGDCLETSYVAGQQGFDSKSCNRAS